VFKRGPSIGLQAVVANSFGVVNGCTDERRTPKAKSAETLSQVVRLVNNDCRLNFIGKRFPALLPIEGCTPKIEPPVMAFADFKYSWAGWENEMRIVT
jgi:hypothetical protein